MSCNRLPTREGGVTVKICGLTRPTDAALAAHLGADALGVVLAPSPRRVDLRRAREVLDAAPPGVVRVGVFVDPDPDLVADAVAACALHWVQLSGREPPERARAIMAAARAAAPTDGLGLLKAVHVRTADDLGRITGYPADAFLLDAPPMAGRMGGTGLPFDWAVAATTLPRDRSGIALAGGLTADSLATAVATVRPAMVDVSSGVESAPGIKDAGRLSAFLEAARRIKGENAPCGQ